MNTTPSDPTKQIEKTDLIKLIYVLLAVDQFDTGVWGASIESQDRLYGEKHDPGSISVSVNCAFAMSRCVHNGIAEPVSRLRSYLVSRRSANGAFGMMRSMGSADYPAIEVLEHARHTAAAIRFFSKFDSPSHPYVIDGIRYLLNPRVQTPSGLWVDYGEATDERVDPITVSAIIESLGEASLAARHTSILDKQTFHDVDSAIRRGLNYLFDTAFRTTEGMWLYRFSTEQERLKNEQNAYRYTMGIVAGIVSSCQRFEHNIDELINIQKYVEKIFRSYGGYIPHSAYSRDPSFDASWNFIRFSQQLLGIAALDEASLYNFRKVCQSFRAISSTSAPDWTAILSFFVSDDSLPQVVIEEERSLEHVARNLKPGFVNSLSSGQLERFVERVFSAIISLRSSNELGPKHISRSQVKHGVMKILFLAANPSQISALDLEEELRSFEQELRAARFRDSITLVAGHAARPDDLVRLVRKESPNVIHFSGHGSSSGIVFRNDTGGYLEVEGNNLSRFLEGRGVKLVVLNACYSSGQADAILGAVEAVVGTTGAVGDEAARRFTVAFYRSLGNGLSVREAFRDGRDAVTLHGLSDVFYSSGKLDVTFANGPED